jgi:hypothetical protein
MDLEQFFKDGRRQAAWPVVLPHQKMLLQGSCRLLFIFQEMVWVQWSFWTEVGAEYNRFIVIHGKPAATQHCAIVVCWC